MDNYKKPAFKEGAFQCPHCHIVASQSWVPAYDTLTGQMAPIAQLLCSVCLQCAKRCVWWDEQLIFPADSSAAPDAADFMPELVRKDYDEARVVLSHSPRASCGLLRLATEKVCAAVLGKSVRLNDAIATLVGQGISSQLQQALDIVRLTGNDSVHAGGMEDEDSPARAMLLFQIVNLLVDERIGMGERLKAALAEYPAEKQRQIEERNTKALALKPAN